MADLDVPGPLADLLLVGSLVAVGGGVAVHVRPEEERETASDTEKVAVRTNVSLRKVALMDRDDDTRPLPVPWVTDMEGVCDVEAVWPTPDSERVRDMVG